MPIYAYRCEDCGFQKDVLQKMSDPLLTVCPSCNKETFKKQLTAAGFQLKGSGWYVTDFRNNDAKPGGKSGEAATGAATGAAPTAATTAATAADGVPGDSGGSAASDSVSSPASSASPAAAAPAAASAAATAPSS
jgi:putative FmdB family regulatory protein